MPKPVEAYRVAGNLTTEQEQLGAAPGDWIVTYDDGSKKAVPDSVMRTMPIRPKQPW